MNYKFTVTIEQEIKYHEKLVGTFDTMEEVDSFVRLIMAHFEEVSISIDVELVQEEEAVEEAAEEEVA